MARETTSRENIPALLSDSTDEPNEQAESVLVAAAKADPGAFAPLYRNYRGPIYRYLRARTGTNEDAADLTQQVFLRALEALPGYVDRGLPFGAWLFRIARNLAIDVAREGSRMTDRIDPTGQSPESYSLERWSLQPNDLEAFEKLLAPLDDAKRDLLTLRFVADLTTREIAKVLGKSHVAVRVQLSRTLAQLKERLDEEV